jgi:hypothetical protein
MLLLQESHLNHVKKSTLSELLRVNVAQASSNSEYALCNSMAITVLIYGGSNRGCGGRSDGCSKFECQICHDEACTELFF